MRCVQPMQPDAAGCACCRARCGLCGLLASCPALRLRSGARRERRGEKWAPGIIFALKKNHSPYLIVILPAKFKVVMSGRTRRTPVATAHTRDPAPASRGRRRGAHVPRTIVIVIAPVPRVASLCAGEPATPVTADPGAHRRPGGRVDERTRALQLHPLLPLHTSFCSIKM